MMALRYSLRSAFSQVQARSLSVAASNNAETYKMPVAPYIGMGPAIEFGPAGIKTMEPPKTFNDNGLMRLYYIPEFYFKFMAEKLGNTGGYTLFLGAITALVSKELLVLDAEVGAAIAGFMCLGWVITHHLHPLVDVHYKVQEDLRNQKIQEWREYKMSLSESEVDGIARLKEQSQGLNLVQQQRKNNLALALDAEYMNRQADLTEAVKKRLDYHVAVTNAEKDVMSKHMISWIEKEVTESIGKRNAAADLSTAIQQLKDMAKPAKA